jgi:hypothetical protein
VKAEKDDHIISLDDLAERDGKPDVKTWLLAKCDEAIKAGKIKAGWDGATVAGEPVMAFINFGRWGARCKVCNTPMYVSPRTPVFFCVECGNGGTRAAWGVEFPEDRERIEAALLRRETRVDESKLIRNRVERAFKARPVSPDLARNWRAGIGADDLENENAERGAKR